MKRFNTISREVEKVIPEGQEDKVWLITNLIFGALKGDPQSRSEIWQKVAFLSSWDVPSYCEIEEGAPDVVELGIQGKKRHFKPLVAALAEAIDIEEDAIMAESDKMFREG